MGISKEEAIKELQNRETVFVAYSQATKLPYVKCDEETYNDQAWIFSTEEGIKEFGKKMPMKPQSGLHSQINICAMILEKQLMKHKKY